MVKFPLSDGKKLHATTTMQTQISYWNLTNSHWEPCESRSCYLFPALFMCIVSDRSLDIHRIGTTFAVRLYFNVDWSQIASEGTQGGMNVKLSSRERLDLNLSTTFAELAISTLDMWGKEGERVLKNGRGSYAPYRIRNRTGSPVCIWSNVDGSSSAKREPEAVPIADEEAIDWRFDDWRTMREVLDPILPVVCGPM
jgi:vacuolar protein sorting-associated protein 13A/C